VRVLVFILALAFDGPIGDDSEDPEHPEENTDTAAKNERYSSTFPTTQMHQRMVEAGGERTLVTMEAMVVETVVVRNGRRGVVGVVRMG